MRLDRTWLSRHGRVTMYLSDSTLMQVQITQSIMVLFVTITLLLVGFIFVNAYLKHRAFILDNRGTGTGDQTPNKDV